jgi:hypothetical protein
MKTLPSNLMIRVETLMDFLKDQLSWVGKTFGYPQSGTKTVLLGLFET